MQLGFKKPLSSLLQIEIKRFLESVYGLKVEQVRTLNYEGKKKRRKTGFFRQSDYKKVSARGAFRQQINDAYLTVTPAALLIMPSPIMPRRVCIHPGRLPSAACISSTILASTDCRIRYDIEFFMYAGICHSEAARRSDKDSLDHGRAVA